MFPGSPHTPKKGHIDIEKQPECTHIRKICEQEKNVVEKETKMTNIQLPFVPSFFEVVATMWEPRHLSEVRAPSSGGSPGDGIR